MNREGGLTDIAVFVQVVDTGSFSKSAKLLRLSPAAASKYVTRLEARLGARLLNRTTRRLSLTEAGAALYERSRDALRNIEDAELEVSQFQAEPRGMLKVAIPMSFGILHIAPAISEFLAYNPRVSVEMKMDDRIVDLVHDGFDLAIRIANLAESTLVARRLAPCRFVVCAADAYFERRGVPLTPDDLRDHNCLLYTNVPRPNVWHFAAPDASELAVPVSGNLRINNGLAKREALLQGLGIGLNPTFYVGEAIREGRLRAVLTDYKIPESAIYAVYPERKYLSPKVRAFIDFFAQRFSPDPYWDRF
ncbi:MAG: LysR family transcriptional regulator [Burkholderiales bacterium]